MPIQSYNSQSNKSHKLPKVAKLIGVAVVVVGIYALGAGTSSTVFALAKMPLSNACTTYVNHVTNGELEAAYNSSSKNIKDTQKLEDFKKTLANLKHRDGTPTKFVAVTAQTLANNRNSAVCSVTVDNIQTPTDNSRTDANFTLGLTRHGLVGWQVSSVSVE